MGSHSDVLESKGLDPAEKLTSVIKRLKKPLCKTGVELNCTLLSSNGLNRLFNVLKEYSRHAFKDYKIDIEVHFLKVFIINKLSTNCTACVVSSMMHMILKQEKFVTFRKCGLLPLTVDALSKSLDTLSECGEILYLKNSKDVIKGWVVLKLLDLLSQINGTIFASPNRLAIFGNTGIVTRSKIKELFKYRYRNIIKLMVHMEFCQQLDDAEVLLINKCIFSSVDPSSPEEYYFFPALVQKERPKASCESMMKTHYRCGWCMKCEAGTECQFLSPRFLHVLLLRLALLYGQTSSKTYKLSSIHKECNVWKNGVHWQNMDGVTAIVEVVEQNTAVVMVMGCLEGKEMNCVKHRSELIQVILQTKEQYSPAVVLKESLIHPEELSTYPLNSLDFVFRFKVCHIAIAIEKRKDVVTDQLGLRLKMLGIDDLLHFDSFVSLSPKIISKLYDEAEAESEVTDNFLDDCAKVAYLKMAHFKDILVSPEQEREFVGAVEQYHDQFRKDPTYKCLQMFITWKKSIKNPTYSRLREALDKYSIFQGRNPLVTIIIGTSTVEVILLQNPMIIPPCIIARDINGKEGYLQEFNCRPMNLTWVCDLWNYVQN